MASNETIDFTRQGVVRAIDGENIRHVAFPGQYYKSLRPPRAIKRRLQRRRPPQKVFWIIFRIDDQQRHRRGKQARDGRLFRLS